MKAVNFDSDAPGWKDNLRDDGAMVMRSRGDGGWVVIMPDGRPPLTTCPCCKKTFRNAFAAQFVANEVYPPEQLQ